jgi:hypothetical protein
VVGKAFNTRESLVGVRGVRNHDSRAFLFLAQISIASTGSLRTRDPMGTVFAISNESIFSIYDVRGICGLGQLVSQDGSTLRNFNLNFPDSTAKVLAPGNS